MYCTSVYPILPVYLLRSSFPPHLCSLVTWQKVMTWSKMMTPFDVPSLRLRFLKSKVSLSLSSSCIRSCKRNNYSFQHYCLPKTNHKHGNSRFWRLIINKMITCTCLSYKISTDSEFLIFKSTADKYSSRVFHDFVIRFQSGSLVIFKLYSKHGR